MNHIDIRREHIAANLDEDDGYFERCDTIPCPPPPLAEFGENLAGGFSLDDLEDAFAEGIALEPAHQACLLAEVRFLRRERDVLNARLRDVLAALFGWEDSRS